MIGLNYESNFNHEYHLKSLMSQDNRDAVLAVRDRELQRKDMGLKYDPSIIASCNAWLSNPVGKR